VADTVQTQAGSYSEDVRVPAHGIVSLEMAPSTDTPGNLPLSGQPAQTNVAAAALGTIATASSSVEDAKLGWGVARLTDGQRHEIEFGSHPIRGYTSKPQAAAASNLWVQIDLGRTQPVDTVVLWPEDSQAQQGGGFPDDFTIDGSRDGHDWHVLKTEKAYTAGANIIGPQEFEVPATDVRYLKIVATRLTQSREKTSHYALQLAEIAAYRNGVIDGGFESGKLNAWQVTGHAAVQSTSVHNGNYAVALSGDGSAVATRVTGLLPNTTYTFGGYLRPDTAGDAAAVTVSDFGAAPQSAAVDLGQWAPAWVTFTTGPDSRSATLKFSKPSGHGKAWGDDFVLTQGASTTSKSASDQKK